MADDPVTLGELSRRLDAMEHRIDGEFSKLGRSIDALRFVNLDQYRAERDAMLHRIIEIEDDRRWMMRLLIAAVVTSIIIPAATALVLGGAL